MQDVKKMRFVNPATGRSVGYWSAKYLGIIPQEILNQEAAARRNRNTEPNEPPIEVDLKIVRMKDMTFDSRLFVPILTNNEYLDCFLSSDGGFMPATNIVMIGGPGVGKSTIGMDLASKVALSGKRVLFVSGEMNSIDLNRYCKRFPAFAELDVLFMGDYIQSSPQGALEKALSSGYDLVLVDSFAEVCITVKEQNGWSQAKAESWLLDLMDTNNKGNNDQNLFTCFLVIQQVTKGGLFVGSNRIKHMTSGMLHLVRDRRSDTTSMEFSKNRVGNVGEELAYSIGRDYINYSPMDRSDDEDIEEVEIEVRNPEMVLMNG